MRDFAACVCLLVALLVLPGCPSGDGKGNGPASRLYEETVVDGLRITLTVPDSAFAPGSEVPVTFTVTNTTDAPRRIVAPSGSPYFLRLWREVATGWDTIQRFPQADIQIVTPWTLEAGETRTWSPALRVRSDWPTHEPLRLSGEVNGLRETRVFVTLRILPEGRTGG